MVDRWSQAGLGEESLELAGDPGLGAGRELKLGHQFTRRLDSQPQAC